MQKGWIFASALALALAGGGCGEKSEDGSAKEKAAVGHEVKAIYAFADCTPDEADILGTINIIVPNKLNPSSIDRRVFHGKKIPVNDPETGENNGQGFKENKRHFGGGKTDPFDVFVQNSLYGDENFVRVRVMIRNGEKWEFYEEGDFHGVGTNRADDTVLCGVNPVVPARNPRGTKGRLIASFYVNLEELFKQPLGEGPPFTIGLKAGAGTTSSAPIFIDPKVRNDGGGLAP